MTFPDRFLQSTANAINVHVVEPDRTTFTKEARHIQERAWRDETAVVRLGPIIFFCANQDAWMLDPADRFARCLMRAGEKRPLGITETKAIQHRVERGLHR